MNKCKYCNKDIEEKTKAGKPRLYCNKSCARKFVTQNKPEVVQEANKRGYQTLKQNKGSDFISHRGRSTEKKKEAAKRLNDNGHFSLMQSLSSNERTPEQIEKWRKTFEENGHTISDPNWKQYQRKCRRLTAKLYGSAGDGYHWDHVVPLVIGFEKGLSPELMCSEINIQKLLAKENLKKGHSLTEQATSILESLAATQSEQSCSNGSCAI